MYDLKRIISEIIQFNQNNGNNSIELRLNESQRRAVELIKAAYDTQGIGVVQGPPGTGKTTVVTKGIDELLSRIEHDKHVKLVYVAPTDKLVVDTYAQILLLRQFTDFNDVIRRTRILASQVGPDDVVSALRAPVNDDVEFIITTEFQNIYSNKSGYDYVIIVDEASKSPIYRFLTPTSLELIRSVKLGYKVAIDSLSVVGDPMQAISLEEIYRKIRDYLLMERLLRSILSDAGVDPTMLRKHDACESIYTYILNEEAQSKLQNFQMLDITYRLPSPSHEIISKGFYGGLLRSYYSVRDRLSFDDNLLSQLPDCLGDSKIAKAVIDAVKDQIGVIYIDTKEYAYNNEYGLNIDARRAYIAIEAAIISSITTGKSTTILPIYRDMVNYIKFVIKTDTRYSSCIKKLESVGIKISVTTAHAMLGSEDYNIVAVLGKEYLLSDVNGLRKPTIYFKEPEIFNVQFSRHKGLLIIVGNVERLARNARSFMHDFIKKSKVNPNMNSPMKMQLLCSSQKINESTSAILDLCGMELKNKKARIVRDTGSCKVVQL